MEEQKRRGYKKHPKKEFPKVKNTRQIKSAQHSVHNKKES